MLKSKLLTLVAKPFARNEQQREYPQLWYCVCRIRPKFLIKIIQFVCGLTGHELSKTEWGYGGGKYADRWCRWCNKRVRVPKDSLYFQFDKNIVRNLMKMLTNQNRLRKE